MDNDKGSIVIGEKINEDENSLGFALGIKKQIYNIADIKGISRQRIYQILVNKSR